MSDKRTVFYGFLKGMQDMGAEFVKIENNLVYFDILTGSKIDNDKYQRNAKKVFEKTFGFGIAVRNVSKHNPRKKWPVVI